MRSRDMKEKWRSSNILGVPEDEKGNKSGDVLFEGIKWRCFQD